MTSTTVRRERMSAAERREEILEAAMVEFGIAGLHGTSTDKIAVRAGVSQPYLFRLFGTKKELFLACARRGFDRVIERFRAAAEAAPQEERLAAMGAAYAELLSDRQLLLCQMQAYAAAASDPEIAAAVRDRYAELFRLIERVSGASADELRAFLATGMLMNVAAALDLQAVADREPWAGRLLGEEFAAKLRDA